MEIRIHKRKNTVLELIFFLHSKHRENLTTDTQQTHTSRQEIFLLANAISKTVLHNKLRDDGMAQHYSEALKPVLLTLRLIQGQCLLMLDPPS